MPRPVPMMSIKLWLLLVLLAGSLAWLYRSTDLAKRPMHTDEAILGKKTIEVCETGHFKYDPEDFHGPLLHFSTRWLGHWLHWTPEALDENKLRFVTALYGMLLLLIPLLLADALGRGASAVAALLAAVSPMMVFYSRYYIMETPFVFFIGLFIAGLWRWTQSRNWLWLLIAGGALGAAHAAKETFVLNVAAMTAGYFAAKMFVGSFAQKPAGYSFTRRDKHAVLPWLLIPISAALVSVAFYSNFFHDWQGVKDSVLTYERYSHRAGGAGHAKPWDYYLSLLFWHKNVLNTWSEALIGGLAILGALSVLVDSSRPAHQRAFQIFLSVYAFALLGIYCVIPYKTPWSVLGVDQAFTMLAGVGVSSIFRAMPGALPKAVLGGLLTVGIYNLCHQTALAIDYQYQEPRYSDHELNPYVYSHTTGKIPKLSNLIHGLAAVHPQGKDMPVQVIDAEEGWPLGWYLRDLHHVGYQKTVPKNLRDAAVIVVDQEEATEVKAAIAPRAAPVHEEPPDFVGPPEPPPPLDPKYDEEEPVSLRTQASILLNVFVRHDLLERYRAKHASVPPKPGHG